MATKIKLKPLIEDGEWQRAWEHGLSIEEIHVLISVAVFSFIYFVLAVRQYFLVEIQVFLLRIERICKVHFSS